MHEKVRKMQFISQCALYIAYLLFIYSFQIHRVDIPFSTKLILIHCIFVL